MRQVIKEQDYLDDWKYLQPFLDELEDVNYHVEKALIEAIINMDVERAKDAFNVWKDKMAMGSIDLW